MKHFYRLFLVIPLISSFFASAMEVAGNKKVSTLKSLCVNSIISDNIPTVGLPSELVTDVNANKFLKRNENHPIYALRHALKESASIDVVKQLTAMTQKNNIDLWMYASQDNHIELLDYLIKEGFDIHFGDDFAIRKAVENRQIKTVEFLLAHGSNCNVRGPRQRTLVMDAIVDQQILSLLLSKGALVNERDEAGRTALMFASMSDYYTSAGQILIDSDAQINASDINDLTALDYAIFYNKPAMIALLKKNHATNNKYVIWIGGTRHIIAKNKMHSLLVRAGIGATAAVIGYCAWKYLKK